ncbi:MAG: hypothetical protein GEU93_06540 [Propionibacteriales bacterium]|nr:hypothetical protein [Propionibacteriales bacterium]
MWGDDGDDRIWGQDADDQIFGENGHDDLFGDLGDDQLFGGFGEDAILGDRGGVLGEYVDESDDLSFTVTFTQVPAETYFGLPVGTLDRRTDLLADTEAGNWMFSDDSPAPHAGLTEGGSDRIRGGPDRDSVHAGFGDDLANGDSGGDEVFGAHGADVIWGGRGCDPNLGDTCTADDLSDRDDDGNISNGEKWLDHVFGGTGATDGPSIEGALGADLLDWNPRGSHDPGTGCTTAQWPEETPGTTLDPCAWFEMTEKHDANPANDQHHHGTDWIYGGWDRDILQADVGANGPNPGDRLLDWNGAFNLYTHCNAAYGGFNDVRQHSPTMNDWFTKLAYGSGASRDADDSSTPGSSAFRELAYVYQADIRDHGAGRAYPTTPGHFDDPVACSD